MSFRENHIIILYIIYYNLHRSNQSFACFHFILSNVNHISTENHLLYIELLTKFDWMIE